MKQNALKLDPVCRIQLDEICKHCGCSCQGCSKYCGKKIKYVQFLGTDEDPPHGMCCRAHSVEGFPVFPISLVRFNKKQSIWEVRNRGYWYPNWAPSGQQFREFMAEMEAEDAAATLK